jgi:hypothetical protein
MSARPSGCERDVVDHVMQDCFSEIAGMKVLCLYTGTSGLWGYLQHQLRQKGNIVSLMNVPFEKSSIVRWLPTCLCAENRSYQVNDEILENLDLVILGIPLYLTAGQGECGHEIIHHWEETIFSMLSKLEVGGPQVVYVDWPITDLPWAIRSSATQLYARALTTDYEAVRTANRFYSRLLSATRVLQVTDPFGTELLIRKDDSPVRVENCHFSADERVFQLPGGEVYCALAYGCADGQIAVRHETGIQLCRVTKGLCRFDELPGYPSIAPVCEFGVGTNSSAELCAFLPFGEKVLGTCHIGFGDNRALGGDIRSTYHFDVVVAEARLRSEFAT